MINRLLIDWTIDIAVHKRIATLARLQSKWLTGLLKIYFREFLLAVEVDLEPKTYSLFGTAFIQIDRASLDQCTSITPTDSSLLSLFPSSSSRTSLQTKIVTFAEGCLCLSRRTIGAGHRIVWAEFFISRRGKKPWGMAGIELVTHHVVVDSWLLVDVIQSLLQDLGQLFSFIYLKIFTKGRETYLQKHCLCIRSTSQQFRLTLYFWLVP